MDILIKHFNKDNSDLFFTFGKFDKWAVKHEWLDDLNAPIKVFPRDRDYFSILQKIGNKHDKKKDIYVDLYTIYCLIPQVEYINEENPIDTNILQVIEKFSQKYGEDKDNIELVYSVIYAAMLAEQLKENSIIGKSIKMLGLYQILIENKNCIEASNFSKGMPVAKIKEECKNRLIPYEYVVSRKFS